jgi:putative transposase
MKRNKAYKFRIYPNKEQQVFLNKNFGCARFIWNRILDDNQKNYEKGNKFKINSPKVYKEEFEWLKEVDSLGLTGTWMNLKNAFDNFFSNPKHFDKPTFKSKKNKQSYRTNNLKTSKGYTIRLNEEQGKLKIPKLKTELKIKNHRRIKENSKIKSVTLSKNRAGKYYASILVEYEVEKKPYKDRMKVSSNEVKALDFSLKNFYVDNENRKPMFPMSKIDSLMKKLQKEHRKLSKKVKGSNNKEKQRLRLARVYDKIRNIKKDFIEKESFKLANSNYEVIVIETLNLKEMMSVKSKYKFGKSVAKLNFGEFTNRLETKLDERNKYLFRADKWFPSSKLCSECGFKNHDLKLEDRTFTCPTCDNVIDRDYNAALNLKNKYLKICNIKNIPLEERKSTPDSYENINALRSGRHYALA